jgi:hypothetical protein
MKCVLYRHSASGIRQFLSLFGACAARFHLTKNNSMENQAMTIPKGI